MASSVLKPVRSQGGQVSTSALFSARVGGTAALFVGILQLHVPEGYLIADVTYGQGVFWQQVPPSRYRLLFSDLSASRETDPTHQVTVTSGIYCRSLFFASDSLDALMLDPPYMEGFYRKSTAHLASSGSHASFRSAYSSSPATPMIHPLLNGMPPSWNSTSRPGWRPTLSCEWVAS